MDHYDYRNRNLGFFNVLLQAIKNYHKNEEGDF